MNRELSKKYLIYEKKNFDGHFFEKSWKNSEKSWKNSKQDGKTQKILIGPVKEKFFLPVGKESSTGPAGVPVRL